MSYCRKQLLGQQSRTEGMENIALQKLIASMRNHLLTDWKQRGFTVRYTPHVPPAGSCEMLHREERPVFRAEILAINLGKGWHRKTVGVTVSSRSVMQVQSIWILCPSHFSTWLGGDPMQKVSSNCQENLRGSSLEFKILTWLLG